MADPSPQALGLLSKVVLATAVLLIGMGVFWQDVTLQAMHRFWHDLAERPSGPMAFRFVLQPAMAVIAAFHDGVRDGRTGRSPLIWTIVHRPTERLERLREGLNATARIILLGLAVDIIYQIIALKTFYPVEAVVTALILAFVPYLLLRGPVARVTRRCLRSASANEFR